MTVVAAIGSPEQAAVARTFVGATSQNLGTGRNNRIHEQFFVAARRR